MYIYIYNVMYVALLYIYIALLSTLHVIYKCQNICMKNQDIFFLKVTLPKLQRLNKITKSVKGVNLETN